MRTTYQNLIRLFYVIFSIFFISESNALNFTPKLRLFLVNDALYSEIRILGYANGRDEDDGSDEDDDERTTMIPFESPVIVRAREGYIETPAIDIDPGRQIGIGYVQFYRLTLFIQFVPRAGLLENRVAYSAYSIDMRVEGLDRNRSEVYIHPLERESEAYGVVNGSERRFNDNVDLNYNYDRTTIIFQNELFPVIGVNIVALRAYSNYNIMAYVFLWLASQKNNGN